MFNLRCIKCGTIFLFTINVATCPYHNQKYGYLEIVYNRDDTNRDDTSTLLPFRNSNGIFPMAKTPLFKSLGFASATGIKNLYIKDESKNPTGSFKDRENVVFFNYLLENNIKQDLFIISSGNAALSTAAYARQARLNCTTFIPSSTSKQKKELIRKYGAQIVEKDKSYEEIYNEVCNNPPKGINATPGLCPLKEEGNKLIAYEIVEQLGVPDKVIVPCGNGTNLWGIYKGFKELYQYQKIKKIPQMIGVQVSGGDPLTQAYLLGKEFISLPDAPESLAEGIIATESYASPKALKAINESKGMMISVTEKEIEEAHEQIQKMEHLTPEFTSSSVYAAVKKIKVTPDEIIVCINTGSAVKKAITPKQLFVSQQVSQQ